MSRRVGRRFFERPALEVAPDLLNKVLVAPGVAGRIVETEAYQGADDPGSHAYRGVTPRTEVMFGPPGHLYVYFTYGMHWCANVVTDRAGTPGAVLIRAVVPIRGIEAMRLRRSRARRDVDLANGPAKVAQAFAIDGTHDGIDLTGAHLGVSIRDDGTAPPAIPAVGVRIGLSKGQDLPWRFAVPDCAEVSRPHPTTGHDAR
ncbi:MAG: putative 3-methyladenine DNA glycosylase [Acidimicrobiales bacterium]|nr:MAG: putative 3-methyladenine DNA glycosylase [Acidimicrobiales bacterium]